jgi:hypothetical protein
MSLRGGAEVVVSRPDTYIGLSTVNRQVRAEFRPLFFSSHKGWVKIRLNELAQFLQAFFPDGRVNAPLRLVIVEVKKGETDTHDWDMLPLLYAKARSSNVEFYIRCDSGWCPGPPWTRTDKEQEELLELNSKIVALVDFFAPFIYAPPTTILEAVNADFFSKLEYCRFREDARDFRGFWSMELCKAEGGLRDTEVAKVEERSRTLQHMYPKLRAIYPQSNPVDDWRHTWARVHCCVKDADDRAVEVYKWDTQEETLTKRFLSEKLKKKNQAGTGQMRW